MMQLTEHQERTLVAIANINMAGREATGWEIAKTLWPDSPAWEQRTRFHSTSNQGAMGGTMPMKGAKAGWALVRLGLARTVQNDIHQTRFWLTDEGVNEIAARVNVTGKA